MKAVPQKAKDSTCLVPDEIRHECGYAGIIKEQCSLQGCCWGQATQKVGAPWCFNATTKGSLPKSLQDNVMAERIIDPTCNVADIARIECGYQGMHSEECLSKGCCWKPASLAGAPYCFNKTHKTKSQPT